jgi:ATP-dependent DNA ligase
VGIRLITRNGHDWSIRYPLVVEAVNHFKVRSCLIDGEVVCCDEKGVAAFQLLRHRRNEPKAFLYAFDLLELNGTDLRRKPIEVRKATLASILRKSAAGFEITWLDLIVLTSERTAVPGCDTDFPWNDSNRHAALSHLRHHDRWSRRRASDRNRVR